MDIGFEALITAVFLLLPGFIAASLFGLLSGQPRSSGVQITLYSLVASLILFVAALSALLFKGVIVFDLNTSVSEAVNQSKELPILSVFQLFATMIFGAALWGTATGLLSRFSLARFLYNARLTPIAPEDNVFTQVLSEIYRTRENLARRSCGQMDVPWLLITGENTSIFGRLQQGSIQIAANEAFEVYLSPYYQINVDESSVEKPWTKLPKEGLYCHIQPGDQVEIFTARMGWKPDLPLIEDKR